MDCRVLPKLLLSRYWLLASPKSLTTPIRLGTIYINVYTWEKLNKYHFSVAQFRFTIEVHFLNLQECFFCESYSGRIFRSSWPPDTSVKVYFVGPRRKCLHNVTSFQTSYKLCFVLWCLQAKGGKVRGKEVWHRLWWRNSEERWRKIIKIVRKEGVTPPLTHTHTHHTPYGRPDHKTWPSQ